jgi:flagellar motor component MotA
VNWFEGLPEIAAVAVGASGAVAGALWAADRLPLDHPFRWLFPPAEHAPLFEIERLASLADLARREGVLSLEGHVEPAADAVLAAGIRMLIDGAAPGRIRRDLESVLDRTLAVDTRRGSGRWTRVAHLAVIAAATFGLICVWRIGIGAIRAVPALVGLVVCYASLLALAFVGPICDKAFVGVGGGRALAGLMTIEAVMLIADRADGAAVRACLTEMLPPSLRESTLRAAA